MCLVRINIKLHICYLNVLLVQVSVIHESVRLCISSGNTCEVVYKKSILQKQCYVERIEAIGTVNTIDITEIYHKDPISSMKLESSHITGMIKSVHIREYFLSSSCITYGSSISVLFCWIITPKCSPESFM